jgi:glutathione S-transferase
MLKLYHAAPFANSGKVLIALKEKEIPFESHFIDLHRFEQHEPWFLKLNPDGQVPVLDHDGFLVTQTTIISEYLEDAFPDTPTLRPADAVDIARMRLWNKYIDEHVMEAVSIHGWQVRARATALSLDEDEFERYIARIPLEKQRKKWRQAREGFPQADLDAATEKVRDAAKRVEDQLQDGPWLVGDMFTFADINFYCYCGGALERMFPSIGNRDTCPRLLDWVDRVHARPGVAAALAMDVPQSVGDAKRK